MQEKTNKRNLSDSEQSQNEKCFKMLDPTEEKQNGGGVSHDKAQETFTFLKRFSGVLHHSKWTLEELQVL